MTKKQEIQLFNDRRIRTIWDDKEEKWYFSVVDVVGALTDSADPRNYWKVLKNRLLKEGNETVTKCNQLRLLAADGKMRLTDIADQEQLFRLIQSIPSPKAEPFKIWMASVTSERLDEMQDPELTIERAMIDYRRLGYSEAWINPTTYRENVTVARKGGGVAKVAREQLEQQLGRSVISESNSSTLRISGDSPDEQ